MVLRSNSTRKSRLPMISLAQLQERLQELFRVTGRQAGRESQFIQRERKLNGETFVTSLVWGWLANPQATLGELSQSAALFGVNITPQGLAQRMTESAAACLRQVLEASLLLVGQGSEGSETFLERFNGVYLLDSTEVPVPEAWASLWSGGGNQHQQRGALKLQTLWDYQGGGLHFSLHAARRNDATLPVPQLPRGAVRISDNGYFSVKRFQELDEQGCFYVTRLPCKVHLYDQQGQSWSLSAFLCQHAQPDFDGWVHLTGKSLACRLVAQPAPAAVVAQRRQRLQETAKRKGKPVSQEALALAAWTILVTNIPSHRLSFAEAFVLLRLRWQIELLFKLWKQHTCLETSRSRQPHRVMCEIYAKLIGLVIQHALLLATCWDVPNQSLVKLAQTVRKSVFLVAFALWSEPCQFQAILSTLRAILRSGCHLDKRKAQPSHFQNLLSLS